MAAKNVTSKTELTTGEKKTATEAFAHDICQVDAGFDVEKVIAKAKELQSHSWEYGTLAEALLEYYNPEYSVFSMKAFPSSKIPSPPSDIESLKYVKPYIRLGEETLFKDDWGQSDPAALGVSAVLIGQKEPAYLEAAEKQFKYLLESARRCFGGAISHRQEVSEFWADFGYMVPPFLAYWGVYSNDTSYIREAVAQCILYRKALITRSEGRDKGLWYHILGADKEDKGYWSTSNGWMAAGMARVVATMQHWEPCWEDHTHQRLLLIEYIQEIVNAAMAVDDDRESGLLRNYLNDDSWFGETSGTALLASVVYRMAVLAPDQFTKKHIGWADDKREAVIKHIDNATGIAKPAVWPLNHLQREPHLTGSPEGQSFIVLMHAAYRDYICAKK